MTLKARRLVLAVLVVSFIVIWRGNTDRDVVVAQGRKAVVITRIFTGQDGLAHAEDIELDLNARGATDMFRATGAEFSVRPPTAGANPRSTAATDPPRRSAHGPGTAVRDHALRSFRSRSIRRRPCRRWPWAHQPD